MGSSHSILHNLIGTSESLQAAPGFWKTLLKLCSSPIREQPALLLVHPRCHDPGYAKRPGETGVHSGARRPYIRQNRWNASKRLPTEEFRQLPQSEFDFQ